METSVYKDILDDSISGNKIHGGTIDGIEAIYTNGLYVDNAAGIGGYGSINGAGIYIGVQQPIGAMWAVDMGVKGQYGNIDVKDKYSQYLIRARSNNNSALWELRGSAPHYSSKIRFLSGGPNYFIEKLMVGTASPIGTSTILDVLGNSYFKGLVSATSMSSTNLRSSIMEFIHNGAYTNIDTWYTDWLALKSKFDSLPTDGLLLVTNDNLLQISNMGATSITADQWSFLGSLDQAVNKSANVQFNNIDSAGSIDCLGNISSVSMDAISGEIDELLVGAIRTTNFQKSHIYCGSSFPSGIPLAGGTVATITVPLNSHGALHHASALLRPQSGTKTNIYMVPGLSGDDYYGVEVKILSSPSNHAEISFVNRAPNMIYPCNYTYYLIVGYDNV